MSKTIKVQTVLIKLKQMVAAYRPFLGLLLLIPACFIGNLMRWTLFFNIDFIFGSIAVWLVVYLYGLRWGILAGFVGGLCTYFLWGHPYAAIIFTCEALLVGGLFYRYHQNIVLLDGFFWLLIGMPLVSLFYGGILEVSPTQTEIILLKQSVNGIFNSLVASLMLTYIPIARWLRLPQAVNKLSFQQTLFNLLVAFLFFPTLLLIILSSRNVVNSIRSEAEVDLNYASSNTVTAIRAWHQEHLRSIEEIAYQLNTLGQTDSDHLREHLAITQRLLSDFSHLTIIDAESNQVLITTQTKDADLLSLYPNNQKFLEIAKSTLEPIISNLLPQQGSNLISSRLIWNIPIVQDNQIKWLILAEINLDHLENLLLRNNDNLITMTLLGRGEIVIASTDQNRKTGQFYNLQQTGSLEQLDSQTYQWFSNEGSQLMMVRWSNSLFVQESPIVTGLPWTLIVESPAEAEVERIVTIFSNNLEIILYVTGIGLIASALISRQLVKPLTELATATNNLPSKLSTGEPIVWVDSQIAEINFLSRNFYKMSQTLSEKFQQIQQALSYDLLLKRITDSVRDSLDESQILQTAVQELGHGIPVISCDAAIYNADQTVSTICYEYTTLPASALGRSLPIPDIFPDVYQQLLRGEYCLFCYMTDHPFRPIKQESTVIACPIVDDQQVLGDLWLFKPRYQSFDSQELRLVQQVVNQCAIALRQARLYQVAQVQVRALEELNLLKDDFLSTVSHELRTPITNMKMAINMLRITEDPERRSRYLTILETECGRESELINDLLDLQRLASGTKVLELQPIVLREWVDRVIEAFQERMQSRQQILQVDIFPQLPIITSDLNCLERIFSELLNNACKYTPPGESIKVTVRSTRLATTSLVDSQVKINNEPVETVETPNREPPMKLILDVCNSGVEIPAHELGHIFEKFYRVPGIDRWKQGGTGLGLTLVQKMTERLGGNVHVKSMENQTCFTVELPIDSSNYSLN
ncbi:MAG: ATP-binding protein [Cyanobacteriota bacterium]|nr:ATP-binding protein [Cyanobacteriota bacterium]